MFITSTPSPHPTPNPTRAVRCNHEKNQTADHYTAKPEQLLRLRSRSLTFRHHCRCPRGQACQRLPLGCARFRGYVQQAHGVTTDSPPCASQSHAHSMYLRYWPPRPAERPLANMSQASSSRSKTRANTQSTFRSSSPCARSSASR